MESIRNGLYALAIAVVMSTIIFSLGLTSAAGTVSEGLAQVKVGVPVAAGGGAAAQPTVVVQQAPSQPTQAAQAKPQGKIDLSNAAVEGSADAKFVLVEYSDFQCPFCSRFFTQSWPQIKQNYVDTGKVKFVYKHFPLDSIHPQARPAAVAFECARKQSDEKARLFHDKIFENQQSLGDASYKQWAKEVGLGEQAFGACYDSKETASIVEAHFQEGAANGIQGTPGFLITDGQGNILQGISGAQPYAAFQGLFSSLGA